MHGNHGPNNVAAAASQQQSNIKVDTNIGNSLQSNSQQRYKPMDSLNLANQPHSVQKPSNKLASNSENVHNNTTDLNHGGAADETGAINANNVTSANQSKTKTPMCLINELVRANQVGFIYTISPNENSFFADF